MTETTSNESAIFGTDDFFRRDNYAPVADELTEFDLTVEGAIPAELDGWYLRNGPNPRQATGHWFSGDGMLHGVRIEAGRAAWYRNRWVRTESFEKRGSLYNADGTRNLHAGVANTHVVNHAGKTLALVETSLPYEITNDLKTVGAYDFGGKLVDSMTAHPKICPTTGELHFFGYGNIFAPHVTYHRADANGELTVNRPIDVPALTMMHDFALTAEHVVFMDLPVVFSLDVAKRANATCPSAGTTTTAPASACCVATIRSARCAGSTSTRATCSTSPMPTTAAIRLCCNRSATRSSGAAPAGSRPTACCGAGRSTWRPARWPNVNSTIGAIEFPRIDDRLAGLPARYAVSVGENGLVRYDLEHRQRRRAPVRHRGVTRAAR